MSRRKAGSQLDSKDSEGKEIVSEMMSILSDNKTLHVIHQVKAAQKAAAAQAAEDEPQEGWEFGDSLHFVSTVFTTIGYGARTPVTAGGKFLTVLMVITLLPFFLHCLCTSAANINNLIDRILGLAEHYDDLEDLTAEKRNDNVRLRRQAIWKGCVILLGFLTVHMFISSMYHLATTGWNYGDVLYFEFINYSTIGFGDLVPEDDLTVAGAILKNLLVKVPAAIILLTLYIRLLPVIAL